MIFKLSLKKTTAVPNEDRRFRLRGLWGICRQPRISNVFFECLEYGLNFRTIWSSYFNMGISIIT